MKTERLVVGQLDTNCYLVWAEASRNALIIDPADDADFILRKIQDFQLKPKFIVATHGHFDHVLAVAELKLAFQIPFLMHEKDMFLIKRADRTARYFTGLTGQVTLPPDKFLKEGDLIKYGIESLKVIETPGHTPGGISLYQPGILFSGDTLFASGIGRTDYSYASPTAMQVSLKKLFKLPPATRVFPGHGPETTINQEKINF